MAILDSLKISKLGLQGLTPKVYTQQQARLQKQFAKQSQLDLNGTTPPKYTDNQPK